MSQENVVVVRRAYEALNGGDMVAFRELLAPDVYFAVRREDWPEPAAHRRPRGRPTPVRASPRHREPTP